MSLSIPADLLQGYNSLRMVYAAALDKKLVTITDPPGTEQVSVVLKTKTIKIKCNYQTADGKKHVVVCQRKALGDDTAIKVDGAIPSKSDLDIKKALHGTDVELKFILEYTLDGVAHVMVLRTKHGLL
jgi:hypothetical protein